MLSVKKTKEEILSEIIRGRLQPTRIGTREYAGDIFYSDIYFYCKSFSKDSKKRGILHKYLCDELRKNNFYVHS